MKPVMVALVMLVSLAAWSDDSVVESDFASHGSARGAKSDLELRWGQDSVSRLSESEVRELADQIFLPRSHRKGGAADLKGTKAAD